MAEAEIAIREGTEADVPAVLELLKKSLGEGSIPRSQSFWEWKHARNPFGRSPFWVAESNRQIVGLRVFMRWRWQAGSATADAVRAVDTATHPDYQGRGIFRMLTLHGVNELTRRGVAFVFNTPNRKSRPGYLKMGWSKVGHTSLWVAPRDLRALARVVRDRLGPNQVPGAPDDAGGTDTRGADVLDDPGFSRLIASMERSDHKYRTPQNVEYIRWRYELCPACRYGFTASENRKVFVIHRTRRRSGAREVAISELFFDPNDAGVRDISGVLGQVLEASGADYGVIATPTSARSAAALALAGFIPAPRVGPILTVRPMALSTGMPDPLALRSWAPTIGDLELF